VGTAYNNLGLVAADLGDINKAIGLFKKAYSLYKTIYNEDHIKLAFSMTNIGRMYLYKQDPNQAGIWISNALLMRQKKLGEESLYYVESLMASAEIDLINKEFQIANKKLKQVLKVRQAQLPADDWRTAEAKALYSLTDLKKEANAINSYFCSLWQVSEKLGKTHYRVQMLKNKQKIFNLAQKVAEQHKSNPCEYLALKID
jgi:tetratricopeptide (TPR) repeat protein